MEDGGWRMEWVMAAGETGGDYVRAVIWGGGEHRLVLNLECVEIAFLSLPLSLSPCVCVSLVSWILCFLDFRIYPHFAMKRNIDTDIAP